MTQTILMIDDDPEFLDLLALQIIGFGYRVEKLTSSAGLLPLIKNKKIDLVLLDVMLGDENGIDCVKVIQNYDPKIPVMMMSSLGDTQVVVNAMKAGACDYILKTDQGDQFKKKISDIFEYKKSREVESDLKTLGQKMIVGQSPFTNRLVQDIGKVALSEATVFLRGDSGTGKSLIAELIHQFSSRKDKPFVTINCSAIPETLIESELFGHAKGAFTGAVIEKMGKFEYAHGGTIFLDEIGELNADIQVKILRVLQSQEFEKVGGLRTIKVNVRIIAATNRNIEEALKNGKFREDLFYRLNVLPIYVPKLCERREDIEVLTEHFIKVYSDKVNKSFEPLTQNILQHLVSYAWPGNIRELQNVIERAVILAKAPHFTLSDFILQTTPMPNEFARSSQLNTPSIQSVQDLEYKTLIEALEASKGNMSKAAEILGVCRDTLYRRLKKFNIQTKSQKPLSL